MVHKCYFLIYRIHLESKKETNRLLSLNMACASTLLLVGSDRIFSSLIKSKLNYTSCLHTIKIISRMAFSFKKISNRNQ